MGERPHNLWICNWPAVPAAAGGDAAAVGDTDAGDGADAGDVASLTAAKASSNLCKYQAGYVHLY